jgi:cytoskeletal protein RodZ
MSLGALIAKSRTAAHLSVEQLSKLTNIPTIVLRDIENDNFAKCGGETYARGHLRNIAAKVGVDERIFLELFEQEVTAPTKPIRELLNENNVVMAYQEPKRISWKLLAIGSVATLLLFAGAQIIFSNINSNNEPEEMVASSVAPTNPASETAAPSSPTSPEVIGGVSVELVASRGATWLYATDGIGQVLFSGQVSQGERKSFSEATQVNLRVGNAGGVDISVNGKDVGLIGANGDVVNLTYNAD